MLWNRRNCFVLKQNNFFLKTKKSKNHENLENHIFGGLPIDLGARGSSQRPAVSRHREWVPVRSRSAELVWFFFSFLLIVVLFRACDDTCFIRPTYHIVNNVTKHADGHASMEPLNDANGIFLYGGIYHVMNQAGGGNWTHVRENLKHVYTSSNSIL